MPSICSAVSPKGGDEPTAGRHSTDSHRLHFVLATLGTRGDLNPLLAIADELIARHHRVTFATLSRYEPLVTSRGCSYHLLRPEDTSEQEAASEHGAKPKQGETLRSVLFARVEDTYRDLLSATEGADLLAGHHILLPLPMAAECRGIPWVPFYFAPGAMNSMYDPPIIPILPRLHALQRRSHLFAKALNWVFKRYTHAWYEPYRQLRARENFAPETCNYIFDGARSPWLNLALFSPLLGTPQPDWATHTCTTGFPFLNETFHEEHGALHRFLDQGPPPIVATLGSSGTADRRHFFENSLAAAMRLGQRIVLITGRLPESSLPPLDPSLAFAIPYAPYPEVFQHACAIIHSGAVGATAEAMRAGKPMLVVPAAAADQPDNASRAVRLGVARTVSMRTYTTESAEAALRRLLEDGQYGQAAKKASRLVQAEQGASYAADQLVETALTAKAVCEYPDGVNSAYQK